MKIPRIALFSDSYHEANGVARTTLAIEACAKRRNIPLLSVHAGPETRLVHDGSIVRLDLKRSALCSFAIEHDLRFDLAMWRHRRRVSEVLRWFGPDVLHFTGPSDVGQLGALLGHSLHIPMVASWHTNLHQYAARRLRLGWIALGARDGARSWAERNTWKALMLFYKIPRVVLAPNRELASLIERGTGKPAFLMSRGVDTTLFSPQRRRGPNAIVNIGYVGRLSVEKNVRLLQQVEEELDAEGLDVRFTIVGDGSERVWLKENMLRAEFTGVLRGQALAEAYAQMDIFAFPSETDTVGNVVLEAMASGVPVVAMANGGHRFMIEPDVTTLVASSREAFVQQIRTLVKNRAKREAMGAAARARATDLLSWDRIFIDVCNAYDAAISPAEGEGRNRCVLSPA
jgi:glycosyltransferase involved in cell wall biosynthesis